MSTETLTDVFKDVRPDEWMDVRLRTVDGEITYSISVGHESGRSGRKIVPGLLVRSAKFDLLAAEARTLLTELRSRA